MHEIRTRIWRKEECSKLNRYQSTRLAGGSQSKMGSLSIILEVSTGLEPVSTRICNPPYDHSTMTPRRGFEPLSTVRIYVNHSFNGIEPYTTQAAPSTLVFGAVDEIRTRDI